MAALPQPIPAMNEAEYLEFERASEIKHEYLYGEIFAMAGASWNHSVICVNVSTSLNLQLVDKDRIVTSTDLRLKTFAVSSYRYPDVMVICGKPQFVDNRNDTISNPTIIVEVLSPSTSMIDRNEKLQEYLQIESLQEYVLVSQNQARIERYLRQDSGDWLYTQASGLQGSIELPSVSCKLPLSDIYKKVSFGKVEADDEADSTDASER